MELEKSKDFNLISQFRKNLPIYKYRKNIISKIEKNKVVIISGETGCGKTTQIPQYLFEENVNLNRMIGITQPRRVAALTVAQRVANEVK